jgi:AraC family transcriptional regulator
MQKPLIIDFNDENAGLQIINSKPTLSNFKAGWNNIQIKSYLAPAHQAPKHAPKQNAIVIFHKPLKVVRRLLGDEFKDECINIGDVVICPANTPHLACWDKKSGSSLLSMLDR